MVEYASITAALAVLVSSLGGLAGVAPQLPATHAKAVQLVSSDARRERVQVADARAAYRKAPYRKAALKYLYATGWVGARADAASCRVGSLLGPLRKRDVLRAMERRPELLATLRRAKVPRAAAAAAIARGVGDACS